MTQTQGHRQPTASAAVSGPGPAHASLVHVDLDRIAANLARFRSLVGPGVRLCAVVKKGGYGLGALPVARHLLAAGCDMLAVYDEPEAVELVEAGLTEGGSELLIMRPSWALPAGPLAHAARTGRLHLSIHEHAQVAALARDAARLTTPLPVHVFLDTGMSRAGLDPADVPRVLDAIAAEPRLRLAGVYSHLATAEEAHDFAEQQLKRFSDATAALAAHTAVTRHLANTCGTLRSGAMHLDMVRVGLGLWGYGHEQHAGPRCVAADFAFQPAVRWLSRAVHVRAYDAGAGVGYGLTNRLDRPSLLGLVPVGYGDGYPVALSGRAVVRVRVGERWVDAPVCGRVNMDQITIDLTDAARDLASPADALRDAEVELVSNDPGAANSLPRLAALASTHCYELLCRMGGQRVYLGGQQR